MDNWDEARLLSYIENFVEESLTLDYKAAGALDRSDMRKKDQISKDVSAMANSDGGLIIYGIKEYNEPEKKHLPERLDPIDRTKFSKETLEQIINRIRPHISLSIYPIALSSGSNEVAYVVDIPRSNTAHQATDNIYYKRHNFLSEPMEDYEVRDTMNRATTPDMSVEFSYARISIESQEHHYALGIKVKNLGSQVINHFQVQFKFPVYENNWSSVINQLDHVDLWTSAPHEVDVTYRSQNVCFPEEEIDIGREMAIQYKINSEIYARSGIAYGRGPIVSWKLYADNMTPKTGSKPFEELQCF